MEGNKRNRITKEYVMKNMIDRIEKGAKELGVTVDEYYKIRAARKNRVQVELSSLRKKGNHKGVFIKGVGNYKNIKGGVIELGTENDVNVKAFITSLDSKPIINIDGKTTFAERKSVYSKVYGYFSELKK